MSYLIENTIKTKIGEFYSKSAKATRWKEKWDFDPSVKIGDKSVSIFHTIACSVYLDTQYLLLTEFLQFL